MSTHFNWDLDGLDAPRFRAFANLLSIRHGGQLGDPELSEGAVLDNSDEEDDLDDDISEAATDHVVPISSSGHGHLKKKFLDRFAEIVSRERSAEGPHPVSRTSKKPQVSKSSRSESSNSFVATATLREYEDHVKIYVTRNNGLQEQDQEFFRRVELLFAMSSTKDGKPK